MTTTTDTRPAVREGVGVTLFVSDCPDPVFGTVTRVYTNAAGTEVAEVQLPRHQTATQNVEFLRVVGTR